MTLPLRAPPPVASKLEEETVRTHDHNHHQMTLPLERRAPPFGWDWTGVKEETVHTHDQMTHPLTRAPCLCKERILTGDGGMNETPRASRA
jgi:hypothetical protein